MGPAVGQDFLPLLASIPFLVSLLVLASFTTVSGGQDGEILGPPPHWGSIDVVNPLDSFQT